MTTPAFISQARRDPASSILVFDRRGLRRGGIERSILECGLRPCWMGHLPDTGVPASCSRVILVELEGERGRASPLLEVIRDFRRKAFCVVAFTDGLDTWPVRDRCPFLLAGVSHLLDSRSLDFGDHLRRVLGEFLAAEVARESEEWRIKETMSALGIVGVSQAMIAVFRTILRISVLSDLPTLLAGETGTGKELLARAIHALDPKRRGGPFIALNCAALAPTLAESELFGHRRGAFTGAERDRRGLIRAAQGGVLFLDEIGELDLALQAKLLRVLQEHRVLSVGDDQEVPISVRVVAATNCDLGEWVQQGRFRSDLFHRLNVISVHIPALRERLDDIEPLSRAFMAKHADPGRDSEVTLSSDFIEALVQADLPGNVRQLENLVRQALVNRAPSDRSLTLRDLPMEIWQQLCKPEAIPATTPKAATVDAADHSPASDGLRSENDPRWEKLLEVHGCNLARCLDTCERALVSAALDRAQGNQSQAARLLGITSRSVYNKVVKHELRSNLHCS